MKGSKGIARHRVGLMVAVVASISATTLLPCAMRLASAQVASTNWSFTGNLNRARAGHTATLLPMGKVLVIGGTTAAAINAELFDPATGSWSFTGNFNEARPGACVTLLADGKVLIVGGG